MNKMLYLKRIVVLVAVFTVSLVTGYVIGNSLRPVIQTEKSKHITVVPTLAPTYTPIPITLPDTVSISLPVYVGQTFNNCGPATLSMMLSYYGQPVGQDVLGRQMRPYQNPQGNNDDKSIFADEFVKYARFYNLEALHRPNGDIEKLKQLTAAGIPVVVRTWLHPNEDIGHFRIVRGYDESNQTILQDDSYEGPNLSYSYQTFLKLWQPFNYGYILIYSKDKQEVVKQILGGEVDEAVAWRNALSRAEHEKTQFPNNPYPEFNKATALYHLGKPAESVAAYEIVAAKLPPRMLWYQLEPIQSYLENGNYERVFALTSQILDNNNRGFAELYFIRGQAHEKQGNKMLARTEYETAVFYNKNFDAAKNALNSL